MDRTSQNNGVNDFVTQLGIQGVGFGGKGAWGAPWFAAQGYTGIGDTFAATPMHAWDTTAELRDTFAWQRGRHGLKFGGDVRKYIWPMGLLPKSRLLPIHQRLHHRIRIQRWQRIRLCQPVAEPAYREAASSWNPADATAQLGMGYIR
jgi:hypothetical protein